MNDKHQEIYNQYLSLMQEAKEADKCGDRKRAIHLCDQALSCLDKMPFPEKKDMLTYGFIFRGYLNYKYSNYEKAYGDFTLAIEHNPRDLDALHGRARTALVKGPFLQKDFPDHQVITQIWLDITNIGGVENNPEHPIHAFMQMWRQKLSQWGFFPAITDIDLWKDFCEKFPVLYHVVPEKYEHTFSQGLIVFRTFTSLNVEEGVAEGVSQVTTRMDGVIATQANEIEACVFCLSRTPSIVEIRKKIRKDVVLYKIKTECFMRNFLHSVEFHEVSLKTPGLRYFTSHQLYKNKKLILFISAGSVFYGEQVNSYPSSFVKHEDLSDEQEVRIVINLISDDRNSIDSTSSGFHTLTLEDNEPASIEVPNPSEWQRKM